MIIYKVTNLINNKIYIGQSIHDLNYRKKQHYKEAKYHINDHTYFHNALRKYKETNWKWEIIEELTDLETLNNREIYWIDFYKSYKRSIGYNLKLGGNNGGKNSEYTKRLIGEKTKLRWENPELSKKMLQGIYNSARIAKEKSQMNYKKTICAYCGKEFTYRPMDNNGHKPKFCCEECRRLKQSNDLKKANIKSVEKQHEEYQLKSEKLKLKILDWMKTIDITTLSNKEIFIQLSNVTGLQDIRSIMKLYKLSSRSKFVNELSKIYAELTGNCKN